MTMIAQRSPRSASVVKAIAMPLPFRNATFDAALAVLTVHGWPDKAAGLPEVRRVARRNVVVLTRDPAAQGFRMSDNFPEFVPYNSDRRNQRVVTMRGARDQTSKPATMESWHDPTTLQANLAQIQRQRCRDFWRAAARPTLCRGTSGKRRPRGEHNGTVLPGGHSRHPRPHA